MNNIAYIYQPHFMTNCFRVAVDDQQGDEYNYIIVTCSPKYNGVYKYPASNIKNYTLWNNKRLTCVCVPVDDCEKIGTLTDIKKPDSMNRVMKQQSNWFNNNVENVNHQYNEKPDWML